MLNRIKFFNINNVNFKKLLFFKSNDKIYIFYKGDNGSTIPMLLELPPLEVYSIRGSEITLSLEDKSRSTDFFLELDNTIIDIIKTNKEKWNITELHKYKKIIEENSYGDRVLRLKNMRSKNINTYWFDNNKKRIDKIYDYENKIDKIKTLIEISNINISKRNIIKLEIRLHQVLICN